MKILSDLLSLVVPASISKEKADTKAAMFLEAAPVQVDEPSDGGPIMEEVAHTNDGNDITRGYISDNDLLNPPLGLLKADLLSMDRFDDILADPQVEAVYKQLRLSMIEKEWGVTPGAQDKLSIKAADSLYEQINANKWDSVSGMMHYGFHYGFSVAEMLWETDSSEVVIDKIKVRNRRRFMFAGDNKPRLLTFSHPMGVALPEQKFWYFSANAIHSDEPYGMGYAHWLYWLTFFKRNLTKFWLTDLEKFGSPSVVGKFPSNYKINDNPQHKANHAALINALQLIQTDSGVAVPDDMALDLLQAARSSNGTHYEMMLYLDRQISRAILGQSFTADDAAGGQNKGDTYKSILDSGSKSHSNVMDETFNDGPAKWVTDWNYPGAAYPRLYRNYDPPADLKAAVEVDKELFNMGWEPTEERIREVYGNQYQKRVKVDDEEPDDDPNEDEDNDSDGVTSFAESIGVINRENEALDDAFNQIGVERFGNSAVDILQPILDKALKGGAEAIRDDVASLYPEMRSNALEQLIARFLFIADTWGRLKK